MIDQPIRYIVTVVCRDGVVVRDKPLPQSDGGIKLRTEHAGKSFPAYSIHRVNGVRYARLVPRVQSLDEWMRVEESDGSMVYLDVTPLDGGAQNELAQALRYLGDCIVKAFSRA